MTDSLIMLVHGESGAGKTRLSHTVPAPRLVLDAENGSRFVPGRKIIWNPMADAPPKADGTWDTCVVHCRDFATMARVYEWLDSGQHDFHSFIVDSLTELQKRCKDDIRQPDVAMEQQQWGTLLDRMEDLVRKLRDLTFHPVKPLTAIVLLALTDQSKGRLRPLVQGKLQMNMPGYVDVIGYLYVEPGADGEMVRKLLTQPVPGFTAKDRTGMLPATVESPDVGDLLRTIYPAA